MSEILAGLGGAGVLIAVALVALVGLLMPFSMYAAQKWAYRSYQELHELNRKLETLLDPMREREGQP